MTLPMGADALALLAVKVFARQDLEPDLDHLDLDLPSVEAAIAELRSRVEAATVSSFEKLTEHCSRGKRRGRPPKWLTKGKRTNETRRGRPRKRQPEGDSY